MTDQTSGTHVPHTARQGRLRYLLAILERKPGHVHFLNNASLLMAQKGGGKERSRIVCWIRGLKVGRRFEVVIRKHQGNIT